MTDYEGYCLRDVNLYRYFSKTSLKARMAGFSEIFDFQASVFYKLMHPVVMPWKVCILIYFLNM